MSFILHLDKHLASMIAAHGNTTYAILFGIVFAETGLVLTPFLPGDSLLFAAGAFAATGLLQLPSLMAVFIVAAVLGDAVNYAIGNWLGSRALQSKLINKACALCACVWCHVTWCPLTLVSSPLTHAFDDHTGIH